MKISSTGADLFHAYKRMDITNLTVVFRNFAERALKLHIFIHLSTHVTLRPQY